MKSSRKATKKDLENQIEKMKIQLEGMEAELKEKEEKNLRLLAEIQNLHKRYEKEIETARKKEKQKVILEIASLIDLLLSALDSLIQEQDEKVAEGFKMLKDELEKALSGVGVTIEKPVGEKFDFSRHHAVGTKETKDQDEGTIVDVLKCGIVCDGEVLRPSLVVVAKNETNKKA